LAAPVNTAAPSFSAFPYGTETFYCYPGTWTGTPTSYAYQWRLADDAAGTGAADITGATSSSISLVAAYWNKFIRCIVTATNGDGSTAATATLFGESWVNVFAPVNRGTVEYLAANEWDDFATEDGVDVFNETIGDLTGDLIPFPLTFNVALNARFRAPWFSVASEFGGVVGRTTDAKAGCGATLISPTHVLMVHHCRPSGVYFKQADGTEVYRTIEFYDWVNSDLSVGRLDSPITTIDPVAILDVATPLHRKYAAMLEAGRFLSRVQVTEVDNFFDATPSVAEVGDSGHPVFACYGDRPILVGLMSGVGTADVGHSATYNIDRINAVLALEGESLTLVHITPESTNLGAAATSGHSAVQPSARASTSITSVI
jgi:hypothetical protein